MGNVRASIVTEDGEVDLASDEGMRLLAEAAEDGEERIFHFEGRSLMAGYKPARVQRLVLHGERLTITI